MLLESAFYYLFCLKFSSKLIPFSKSYAKKTKVGVFSEHSLLYLGARRVYVIQVFLHYECCSYFI